MVLKSSKIYDPVSEKFTPLNSEKGKLILKNNEMCNKCPSDKIYNATTKRCVSKKGKNFILLEKEIKYCNKYNKAIKEAKNTDKKIIDNILKIKIPGKMLNGEDGITIKRFMSKIEKAERLTYPLSQRLNIKDPRYALIVDFIPNILHGVVQLMKNSPETFEFLKNKIKNILSGYKKSIAGFLIFVFTSYLASPFIVNILSKFSFTHFIAFITSLFAVVTNLPYNRVNKNSVNHVANTALFGDEIPSDPSINSDKFPKKDLKKVARELSEIEMEYLESIEGAYNPQNKTLDLASLGINIPEIANDSTKIVFSKTDNGQLKSFIIFPRYRHNLIILEDYRRKRELSKLETYTKNILRKLNDKKQEILNTMENRKNIGLIEDLEDDVQKFTNFRNNYKKSSEEYKKMSDVIDSHLSDIKKYRKKIKESKEEVDIVGSIKNLDILLKKIGDWVKELNIIKKDFENFNITEKNINYYHENLSNKLNTASNFIKSIGSGGEGVKQDNSFFLNQEGTSSIFSKVAPNSNKFYDKTTLNNNFNKINESIQRRGPTFISPDDLQGSSDPSTGSSARERINNVLSRSEKIKPLSPVNSSDLQNDPLLRELTEPSINKKSADKNTEVIDDLLDDFFKNQ